MRVGARLGAALLLAAVALIGVAEAQVPAASTGGPAPNASSPRSGSDAPGEKARREDRLKALEQRARLSAEARQRLEQELAEISADRSRLSAALVSAAALARSAEERARAAEERLDALLATETGIRRSLESRRGVLAEVLAALQRLGRRPPPAVLVRAEDILEAVRAAMLLGSVMPELRAETRRLASDLAELVRLRAAIAADRDALDAEFVALATERDRLSTLIATRQERLATAEADIRRERSQSERLGQEAKTLRGLIERMEAEELQATQEARLARERFAAAASQEPVRLSPRQPFAETKGSLPRPAAGPILREFGAQEAGGSPTRGTVIATRPRAVVTASADGWIVFAGPFRSYGRLLIINTGGGYYLLLAGLDKVHVEVGQFVLAGEPVGQMGEVAAPSAALGIVEADGPVLYVELRKDGGPIDPGPWWARSLGERARG